MSGVPSQKIDYPPLLSAGRHKMTLADVRDLCVTRFRGSQTRPGIMAALEKLVMLLSNESVEGELWVDGSFLSEKLNPADVDVVLRAEAAFYEGATPSQRAAMESVNQYSFDPLIDGYRFFEWPPEHPFHPFGANRFHYWDHFFTHSRGGEPKGLAVIRLPVT